MHLACTCASACRASAWHVRWLGTCRLEEELQVAASRHEQLQAVWHGRLCSLEARVAAGAAPPPHLLAAIQGIECQLGGLEHRLQDAERAANELDK